MQRYIGLETNNKNMGFRQQDRLFGASRDKLREEVSSKLRSGEKDSEAQESLRQAFKKMNKLQNRDDLNSVDRNGVFKEILHNLSQAHTILDNEGFDYEADRVEEVMREVSKKGLQMDDLSVEKYACERHLPDGNLNPDKSKYEKYL